MANSWKSIISEKGRDEYIDLVRKTENYQKMQPIEFQNFLKSKRLYSDVYDYYINFLERRSALVRARMQFLARLSKLPSAPEYGTLELVEDDAEKFKLAVGEYGKNIREGMNRAAKFRQIEEKKPY